MEKEEWGDDELTALDLSAAHLLERADWTSFYNNKGYAGSYPFLLYMNEDAEVLNERLMGEVNRTQILEGRNKLQLDLFTRFIDKDEDVEGAVWLLVSGMRSIAPDLEDDLIKLFRSGATTWLHESYTSHGEVCDVKWLDDAEAAEWCRLFVGKEPPQSNIQNADHVLVARISKQ